MNLGINFARSVVLRAWVAALTPAVPCWAFSWGGDFVSAKEKKVTWLAELEEDFPLFDKLKATDEAVPPRILNKLTVGAGLNQYDEFPRRDIGDREWFCLHVLQILLRYHPSSSLFGLPVGSENQQQEVFRLSFEPSGMRVCTPDSVASSVFIVVEGGNTFDDG